VRLKPLGLVVKEYTGDMQLTRAEVDDANVIVTTPEKWDVVTRKGGEGALVSAVSLLLIDEVHLLADDRGAVIESVVARTRRLVEVRLRAVVVCECLVVRVYAVHVYIAQPNILA
jgi:replicative superfamily II helicase